MLAPSGTLCRILRRPPRSCSSKTHRSKAVSDTKYSHNQLLCLYHEIHQLLCFLDDLFKCQILDIETMLKSHEALKDHIGCEMSPELNQHLRRYLEFLRMIRPVSYNNPYVVAFNNYNYIRGSNNATDCLGGAGNFAYSRAMGHYIISLIGMLEKVIDFHSNSEPASFKDADFMV